MVAYRNRIYVMGISMGGQATWDLLCRNPWLFVAAVPICGCGDPSNLEKAGVSVLRLMDADPIEPPTAGLYKMDKWGLAYKDTTGTTLGGGIVTLNFVNERVASIDAGGEPMSERPQ